MRFSGEFLIACGKNVISRATHRSVRIGVGEIEQDTATSRVLRVANS